MAAVLEFIATTITPQNFTLANNSTNSTHEQERLLFISCPWIFAPFCRPIAQTTIGYDFELTCLFYFSVLVELIVLKSDIFMKKVLVDQSSSE